MNYSLIYSGKSNMKFFCIIYICLILACPWQLHAQNDKNQSDTLQMKDVEIGEIVIKASRAIIRAERNARLRFAHTLLIHSQ